MRSFWILFVILFSFGCTSSEMAEKPSSSVGWDGKVQQWGTLREVMLGENVDGQVRLFEVMGKPNLYGIGAPDKLDGEILVADSVTWVAKVQDGDRVETRLGSAEDSAVFLAVAHVPRWTEVTVDQDVAADEFDDFIQQTIGLDKPETVPFVINGQFSSLNLHVLNGECPFAEVKVEIEGSGPPHRTRLTNARGMLVGFYAVNGAGRITHHGTHTHVHALVGTGKERVAGHVDSVELKAGTVVRIPAGYADQNE